MKRCERLATTLQCPKRERKEIGNVIFMRRKVAVTQEGFREYCSIVPCVTSRDSSRDYHIVFE
jgi:hypothetical protein